MLRTGSDDSCSEGQSSVSIIAQADKTQRVSLKKRRRGGINSRTHLTISRETSEPASPSLRVSPKMIEKWKKHRRRTDVNDFEVARRVRSHSSCFLVDVGFLDLRGGKLGQLALLVRKVVVGHRVAVER